MRDDRPHLRISEQPFNSAAVRPAERRSRPAVTPGRDEWRDPNLKAHPFDRSQSRARAAAPRPAQPPEERGHAEQDRPGRNARRSQQRKHRTPEFPAPEFLPPRRRPTDRRRPHRQRHGDLTWRACLVNLMANLMALFSCTVVGRIDRTLPLNGAGGRTNIDHVVFFADFG